MSGSLMIVVKAPHTFVLPVQVFAGHVLAPLDVNIARCHALDQTT